jgi:hypothetical protein
LPIEAISSAAVVATATPIKGAGQAQSSLDARAPLPLITHACKTSVV